MDEFFNHDLQKAFGHDGDTYAMPSVNVVESPEAFRLELAAPGMNKEDFDVKIEKDLLTITAEKQTKTEEGAEKEKYVRREFHYTKFKRSFQLSDNVDATKVEARYENGILHLTVPKKEEAKELPARKIEIV
jgi:HSP20 family protein